MGSRDSKDTIELTGRLSIKGNEPFTFLALTTAEGEVYKLSGDLVDELRAKQGEGPIQVTGTIGSADKASLGLKDTVIVSTYRILP